MNKTLAIASDHAGYLLKERIKLFLVEQDWPFEDFGPDSSNSVDYPDYIGPASRAVASGKVVWGIFICGTGLGSSILANRFPGVRAALCHNMFTVRLSRQHNDANVLVLGARVLEESLALQMVKEFFRTPFEGGRHRRRLKKLENYASKKARLKRR